MRKILSLAIALILIACIFAGCGCSRTKPSISKSSAVESTTDKIIDKAESGADDLMDGIEGGADKVGDAVESVVDGVGDAITDENKKPATESDIVAPSDNNVLETSQTPEEARNRA